jgi:glycerate kinase
MKAATIVIAPDSFKGSLGAADVAVAIAAGWQLASPDDALQLIPQADGGEGTLDALEQAVPGSRRRSAGQVTGPDAPLVNGEWLSLPDGTAVIELAQMSGLPLMAVPDPLGATTTGLGQVMAAALDDGAVRLIVGLGGSASTDGGIGALEALGTRRPPRGGVRLLTDVEAPLLGPGGAAAVFGPQKGATAAQVVMLEKRLSHIAQRFGADPAAPGTGAAGGTAYGLQSWGGVIESGAAYIANSTGLDQAITHADVVVTGEGRFDGQSMTGKLVGRILTQAEAHSIPVVVIAGSLDSTLRLPDRMQAHTLVELAGTLDAALADPRRWLAEAGTRAAQLNTVREALVPLSSSTDNASTPETTS